MSFAFAPDILFLPVVTVTRSLHIVIELEVSEQEALTRAFGHVKDPQTAKHYHLHYDPPPVGLQTLGLQERLQPTIPFGEFTSERLKSDILSYEQNAGSLLAWLGASNVLVGTPGLQLSPRTTVSGNSPCLLFLV